MSSGGHRPGSGRPQSDPKHLRTTRSVRLPQWLWDWLDAQEESRGTLIEESLREIYLADPPEDRGSPPKQPKLGERP